MNHRTTDGALGMSRGASPAATSAASPAHRHPPARFIARYLVPGAILGGGAALLLVTGRDALSTAPEVAVSPAVTIATTRSSAQASDSARAGDSTGVIQAPGWIEPAPYADEVRALREGVVAGVHVLEGGRVARGDLLVTLECRAEELALARAEAEIVLAETGIPGHEATLRAADRALALALESDRALRTAESALAAAEATGVRLDAEIAEADALEREVRDELERKKSLADAGAASVGEARRLALRAEALAARVAALRSDRPARDAAIAKARGDLASARAARQELLSETLARDEAQAALATARAQLAVLRARRDEAALALERSEIRAARDGMVLARHAVPGSRVGGDAGHLLTIFDPASLQVRCDVPLKEAGRLAVGLVAEIRVDALPDLVLRGTVTRIVPQGDLQKNTVQCKVSVQAPRSEEDAPRSEDSAPRSNDILASLRPDMLARVRILAAQAGAPGDAGAARTGEGLAIPIESLRNRATDAARVLVAIPDGGAARLEERAVTLGAERANGWIEVLAGLSAGDRVVLDGAAAAGTRVQPRESLRSEAP